MSFKKSVIYPAQPTTTRGVSVKLGASKSRIVYASGKSIFIRDINDPTVSLVYSEHVHPTTAARISPSGYYCASSDAVGTVRIWDIAGEDLATKNEYRVLSGKINDLEWDGESKRIIAVGDGREKFGHAFMTDTGSSTGEISGHSKAINAVSIRHQRPFRAVTASDDGTLVFHHGAPYKYDRTIKTHTKFVQDVRYSSTGDVFASVGSDAKTFLYDGKTGDTLSELVGDVHKGSIMALAWSPSGKEFATASLDNTVKLWDAEAQKSIGNFSMGDGVDKQQVGVVYAGDSIVSLSSSGALNILDARAQGVVNVLAGSQKAVTSAALVSPGLSTFLAGTADGRIVEYDSSAHVVKLVTGEPHGSLVSGIAIDTSTGKGFSVGFDDKIKEIEGSSFVPSVAPTNSQPKSVAASGGLAFVAGIATIEVFKSSQRVHEAKPSFVPSSIAVYNTSVAVGGEDNKVHLYEWDGQALRETGKLEGNKSVVSALAFSPDGALIAAGESSGKICLFKLADKTLVTSRWAYHTAKVNSLQFTADGQHCASGSLDTHVYVWSVARPLKSIAIKNAGPGGVNAVLWIGGTKLATAGADGSMRTWDVTFHA